MKVSTSILSIKDNLQEKVKMIDNTNTDYIHLDIMDGLFVPNKTWEYTFVEDLVKTLKTPLDVHLMVNNLDTYINDFSKLDPEYITFHFEATNDINRYINLIKSYNIKVGIAIKPNTKVELLEPYLKDIDLVLVMSVEPGFGGQKFIPSSANKIKQLKQLNNYNYVIEVDGGINDDTILFVKEAGVDIAVSGSYITNNDNYELKISSLKNC